MSWEQLRTINYQNAANSEHELMHPPTACPNDGEPLREGPNGELFCAFDGWKWTGLSNDEPE